MYTSRSSTMEVITSIDAVTESIDILPEPGLVETSTMAEPTLVDSLSQPVIVDSLSEPVIVDSLSELAIIDSLSESVLVVKSQHHESVEPDGVIHDVIVDTTTPSDPVLVANSPHHESVDPNGVVLTANEKMNSEEVIEGIILTKWWSLGSMFLSLVTYSWLFDFHFAVGMIALIAVHEAGHMLVLHQLGIPFSPMIFIPYMGAIVPMYIEPRDEWEDALVGFGGPALGAIGAASVAVVAYMTQSWLFFEWANFGFYLNLINLFPIEGMDGGRIAGALTPWINVGGLGLGGTLLVMNRSIIGWDPSLYLIFLLGAWLTYEKWFNPPATLPTKEKKNDCVNPPIHYRTVITVGYVVLVALLALGIRMNVPPPQEEIDKEDQAILQRLYLPPKMNVDILDQEYDSDPLFCKRMMQQEENPFIEGRRHLVEWMACLFDYQLQERDHDGTMVPLSSSYYYHENLSNISSSRRNGDDDDDVLLRFLLPTL